MNDGTGFEGKSFRGPLVRHIKLGRKAEIHNHVDYSPGEPHGLQGPKVQRHYFKLLSMYLATIHAVAWYRAAVLPCNV